MKAINLTISKKAVYIVTLLSALFPVESFAEECTGPVNSEMFDLGRGVAELGEVADFAGLADAVYNKPGRGIPDGYSRRDEFTEDSSSFFESGFHAETYEAENGEMIVSFRGSGGLGDPNDWWNNADANVLGRISAQQNQAFDYTTRIQEAFPDREITVVGHSLGGALAQYAGGRNGLRVVTFNSAALSRAARIGIPDKPGNVLNIVHEDDPLRVGNLVTGNLTPLSLTDHLTPPVIIDYEPELEAVGPLGAVFNFLHPVIGGLISEGGRVMEDHSIVGLRAYAECLDRNEVAMRNILNSQNSNSKQNIERKKLVDPFKE